MLDELSRLFDIEAREACPVRIVRGVVVPPSGAEFYEQKRLMAIAKELRRRVDTRLAMRILGFAL
jgi:hypothetical protein